jgi:hypothetical protein
LASGIIYDDDDFLLFHPAAILLCTENTFWYKSQYSSFLDAFKQAFKLYMEMGVEKNGENAVKLLGDWPVTTPEQEIYRSMLTKILLEHRLRESNSILITISF